jgi:hypothetical protein
MSATPEKPSLQGTPRACKNDTALNPTTNCGGDWIHHYESVHFSLS